jgi:type VI secretion system secreted protein VgrG
MNNVISSLIDLASGRQHNRILRLSFPHSDGPSSEFLVNKLEATEGLSRDFEYIVELLSDDATLALKDMQGKLLSIQLVCGDGSLRYFTGYVFQFRRKRSNGSVTCYEARLGPWLKFLSLRKDNYLFHGKTLAEQTDSILGDYGPYAKWEWRVIGEGPAFTDACQFDETDYNYLSRRWEAAGLYYWYEHTELGHQLVIANDSTQATAIDGDLAVRFHAAGGQAEEDAIDLWTPVREIAPSSVALSGFNFKTPVPRSVVIPTLGQQGDVPEIESYEYVGAYGFMNSTDGDAIGKLRMEEMEAACRYFEGEGNNRRLLPGRWFQLTDHFNHSLYKVSRTPGGDEFLVLDVRHVANNNYLANSNAEPTYRNSLTCIRRSVPWRPGRNFNSKSTKILAPQTATVVGPSGPDSIYTDEYGRIRVQFHWDRIGNNDERSSAWLRVASPWAGAELGASSIPRVGSEVIVQWLDGNPDRPIVTGSVYNERNMPPWSVPTQQSLMGLRSRELAPERGNSAGGRSNHLVLDDTNGQIQAQLKSDHATSQLSLGHITRIENTEGRKDPRGEGWEIATEAWGVARAGKGMLITTEARKNAISHIKDMGETIQRLTAAREQHESQAEMAEQNGAQERQQQSAVADSLKKQNNGIRGDGAGDKAGNFPELSQPHLVISSPAGIATSTAQSTHIASDLNTAVTTGQSLSIAAGNSVFASIRQTLRLFVQKAGMRLIAAGGDIDVKALSDSINLIAKLNITQTADRITITAKEDVVINGGGSYVKFSASGIEHGTKGAFVTYSSIKEFHGPKNIPPVVPNLPIVQAPAAYSQQLCVGKILHTDPELQGAPFEVWTRGEDSQLLAQGTLDDIGRSVTVYTDEPADVEIIFGHNEWFDAVDESEESSVDNDELA